MSCQKCVKDAQQYHLLAYFHLLFLLLYFAQHVRSEFRASLKLTVNAARTSVQICNLMHAKMIKKIIIN